MALQLLRSRAVPLASCCHPSTVDRGRAELRNQVPAKGSFGECGLKSSVWLEPSSLNSPTTAPGLINTQHCHLTRVAEVGRSFGQVK